VLAPLTRSQPLSPIMASKGGKMQQYLNYRMRLVVNDGRELIGQFMAFDKHMNVVLGDVEEYRRVGGRGGKEAQVLKRALGLVLLRGENIVSLSVEGPPPPDSARSRTVLPGSGGPGAGRAAGRGVALPPGSVVATSPVVSGAPVATGAPVRGLGGPAPSAMQPRGPPPGFPSGGPPPGFPGGPGAPPGFPPGGFPPGGPPPGFRGGPPPGFPQGFPPGGPPPGFRGGPPPGFPPGGFPPGGPPPGFRGGPPPGFSPGMPPQ